MLDIVHEFVLPAAPAAIYAACATPGGLNGWWTLEAGGEAEVGSVWRLYFGEEYDWRAQVTAAARDYCIEWEFTASDDDWRGTRVRLELHPGADGTTVRFSHRGWATENAHYRRTSFCWALYLRLMARYVERGEIVPYEERLTV